MNKAYKNYISKSKNYVDFDVSELNESQLIVVIPVYLEDKLSATLESLINNIFSKEKISVLLIFNTKEGCAEEIIQQQKETIQSITPYLYSSKEQISFHAIEAFSLPVKHFGAGLARKIGMDLAIKHFSEKGIENGLILSLDADTLVSENYFEEVVQYFSKNKSVGASIYFEHPTEGTEFTEEVYDAITKYELHLRYYIECLRLIDFPYAYHTVGSCFGFRADDYVRVGGMNRRQGGEEFYFIQKLIQVGSYGEINTATVKPSPRISERVPFGTGPSVKQLVEGDDKEYYTYNLQCFLDLKVLLDNKKKYFNISSDAYQAEVLNLPGRVRSYLLNSNFEEEIKNLSDNCSTEEVFKKRFYEVFNAFRLVKYINYTHEHFIEKTPVFDAAMDLLEYKEIDVDAFDEKELLMVYRERQRNTMN